MIILGIDPGTATIGVGVIECDGLKLISKYFGWIETSKDDGAGKRLLKIHQEIGEIISEHKPEVMAIERLFFFINHKTAMAVAESIGVIKLAAEAKNLEVVSFAPLEIKHTVTGNGKADKEMIKKEVRKLLSIRSPNKKKTHFDDLCDALAVGICYAKKNRLPKEEKVEYNKDSKKRKGVKKIHG